MAFVAQTGAEMAKVISSSTMTEKVKKWWICWYMCQLHDIKWDAGVYTLEEFRGHMMQFATAIAKFSATDLKETRLSVTAKDLERVQALVSDACNGHPAPLFSVCHQLLRHCEVRPVAKPWRKVRMFEFLWKAASDMPPEERDRVMDLIMDTSKRIMLSSPHLDQKEMIQRLLTTGVGVLASNPSTIAKICPRDKGDSEGGPRRQGADAQSETQLQEFLKRSREATVCEPAYPAFKRRCFYMGSNQQCADFMCTKCQDSVALPYCPTCMAIIRGPTN